MTASTKATINATCSPRPAEAEADEHRDRGAEEADGQDRLLADAQRDGLAEVLQPALEPGQEVADGAHATLRASTRSRMATRSASRASAMTGPQSTGLPASSSADAGPEALLGPLGLLGRRSRFLLDAVDVAVLLPGHEPLGRPGAVALDPDRGERVVPVPEGELAHVAGRQPLAAQVLAARTEGVVDEDLEAVLALPGPEERDGVADVADALQR